jgi:hypothetical protein
MNLNKSSLLLLSIAGIVNSQSYRDCGGSKNDKPVLDLEAVPLKSVAHGDSWILQEDTNIIYVAKLSGTAYEMGYALGELYG